MYYREEVINGILCFKTTPNGEWKQVSAQEMTTRLLNAKDTIFQLQEVLSNRGVNPGDLIEETE